MYLDPVVDMPLYTEMVEQAINLGNLEKTNGGSGVPTHVKLVLEWDMPGKTQVCQQHFMSKQFTRTTISELNEPDKKVAPIQ